MQQMEKTTLLSSAGSVLVSVFLGFTPALALAGDLSFEGDFLRKRSGAPIVAERRLRRERTSSLTRSS